MAEKALFWGPSWIGCGEGEGGHQVFSSYEGENRKFQRTAQGGEGQMVFRYTFPIPEASWS